MSTAVANIHAPQDLAPLDKAPQDRTPQAQAQQDSGLEVLDLLTNLAFRERRLHPRNATLQLEGMQRVARAFVESPDTILQELVNSAIQLCGADSAGISLETEDKSETEYYRWVATAGQYARFLHATLPRYPSACGICLERNQPQRFVVTQRFFDIMGIEAPLVTDGILLPWQADETRGTIWIVAHGRTEAFDSEDCRMMQILADFAAMAIRHQRQQRTLMLQAELAAAAAMANNLAHEINNPLQSLTNIAYLVTRGRGADDPRSLGQALSLELHRLSDLVAKLLAIPVDRNRAV